MRHAHLESGGRYPALRTIALLYLAGALFVTIVGVWRAIRVFMYGGQADMATSAMFGPTSDTTGRILGGLGWLAVTFIAVIGMFAIAELIKLFIDIEQNTRRLATGTTAAPTSGNTIGTPIAGERTILEGEETAEGALLRGH